MTTMEYRRGSSVSMAFRGRTPLTLRRNQVVSMDATHEQAIDDLDLFQSHLADRLLALLAEKTPNDHQTLTLSFLQKIFDLFFHIEDEFKDLLLKNHTLVSKPPVDRLLAVLLDRAVKSLDVCNAVESSIHSIRHWNRHAGIAAAAISADRRSPPSEGQLNRARKALSKLLGSAESNSGRTTDRAWSSCREEGSRSRNWSAAKQVQAMAAALGSPRGGEGLGAAIYAMSSVLVLAMWALVAAFSCGGSAAVVPVAPPRWAPWAAAMLAVEERIAEEWRRRGKSGGGLVAGVLVELVAVERRGRELMKAAGGGGEEGNEVVEKAVELGEASRRLGEGLGGFERRLREVFNRIVRSRAEVMRCLDGSRSSATPSFVL